MPSWGDNGGKLNLQSTAPLPPQFRHTALSFPSGAIVFGRAMDILELLINPIDEQRHVRHHLLEVDI